jgi:hypothetical protein
MSVALQDLLERGLIGLSAPRALAVVLSSLKEIEEVYVAECRPLPALQNRLDLTPAERSVVERALEQRKLTGLSFWDAVLLELSDSPDAFRLLDAAMMHVSFLGYERSLSWASAVGGGLERTCDEFATTPGASLTLLSEVRCRDGSKRHLPMIDFHSFSSPANQRVVEAVAVRLFPEGAIVLASGESYHAYGTQLLSEIEFRRLLGRALLFAPIVDRAYMAHQLIEGRCALRLTAGGGKSRVPTVVAVVGGN